MQDTISDNTVNDIEDELEDELEDEVEDDLYEEVADDEVADDEVADDEVADDEVADEYSDQELSDSFENSSINNDINDLINKCQEIHHHIHNSCETIQNIHNLVINNSNINIITDDIIRDFDEVLEEMHKEALENIQQYGENNFGELLTYLLEKSTLKL